MTCLFHTSHDNALFSRGDCAKKIAGRSLGQHLEYAKLPNIYATEKQNKVSTLD